MEPFLDRDVFLPEGPERRFREAVHMQEIEGNPFTAEDFEMFAMFKQQSFSVDEKLAFIDVAWGFRKTGLSVDQQLDAFRSMQKATLIVDAAE